VLSASPEPMVAPGDPLPGYRAARFCLGDSCWLNCRIPAKTRVADQKPLACSAFVSSHGGRIGALWTITVDHSSRKRDSWHTNAALDG